MPKEYFVSAIMDSECDRLLTQSAKANNRSKRKEAGHRLKDHMKRYGEEWIPIERENRLEKADLKQEK